MDRVIVLGLLLVFGVFCLIDSAPVGESGPPSWNFLIRKREPPPPVKKVQVEDSLRVPSLDFLVKPTAQDKRSQGRNHADDDDYNDSAEYDDDIRPPRKTKPKPPPRSSSSSSWNVFKTSKRAIVNYVKAVKNMFSNGKQHADDDYRPKNHVQERGDRNNPAVEMFPADKIPKTKYGTKVEVDAANRVKAVAIVAPGDEGDAASDTYFKDKDATENDEGLGIGDAVSDLFWGSVYKGT